MDAFIKAIFAYVMQILGVNMKMTTGIQVMRYLYIIEEIPTLSGVYPIEKGNSSSSERKGPLRPLTALNF